MKNILLFFLLWISAHTFAQVSIVGTATPSNNWTTDHIMAETAPGSGIWTLTITLTAQQIKFRKNLDWVSN